MPGRSLVNERMRKALGGRINADGTVLPLVCRSFRQLVRFSLMVLLSLLVTVTHAGELEFDFDIPPAEARSALVEFARQANIQLLFAYDAVSTVQLNGLSGRYSIKEGIDALISGTCLQAVFETDVTTIITVSEQTKKFWFVRYGKCRPPSATSIALTAAVDTSSSSAQGTPARQAVAVEEIVVTAQRREESLQETPIAITAFGASQLEKFQISNVMDLSDKVPSLVSVPFAGTRVAPNLFIRGMGNLNNQSTNDLAIGIYIDGVPVGRGIGLAADVADLERVEVLRGPQGTLWGRNTTAGAINMVTKKPNNDLSGTAQLTVGSWNQRTRKASVNVPLNDKLFVRASYMRTKVDGWVDNKNTTLSNQVDFYEDDKEAFKVAARFEVSDDLIIDYGYDKSQMDYGNMFFQIIDGPQAVRGRQEKADPVLGQRPSDVDISGHDLTLTWTLGELTAKSITAYRELDSGSHTNFIDIFYQDRMMDQDQFSQELQLLGQTANERVNYVIGLFYIKERVDETTLSSFAGGALLDDWAIKAKASSSAAYGQFSWVPPILEDKLELTFGLRYTKDSRDARKTYTNVEFTPEITGLVLNGKTKFHSTNPMVTLSYAFSDNINAYTKFSTGYRAGGFNTQSTPALFAAGYKQEDVDAYEAGLKLRLFENRATLNMATFYNKYTKLQVDQERTPPIFVDTLNAGDATMKGFEIEGEAVLTDELSVNFFYSILDAEYGSYVDGGVDIKSIRVVPNAPNWQGGVGMTYQLSVAQIGNIVASVDFRAQDDFYGNPKLETKVPGYSFWNARIEIRQLNFVKTGNLRIALWCKNLGDEEYKTYTSNFGFLSALHGPPRSTGLDLIYEF